jgi:hypothetical protein
MRTIYEMRVAAARGHDIIALFLPPFIAVVVVVGEEEEA